jgi:hypothetical protein
MLDYHSFLNFVGLNFFFIEFKKIKQKQETMFTGLHAKSSNPVHVRKTQPIFG